MNGNGGGKYGHDTCALCGYGLFWVDEWNIVVFGPNGSAHAECCKGPNREESE